MDEMEVAIKRTSAPDEVFKILHEWILSGKFKPGDMLPSQDKLAKQFGVSRNTLREALNRLTIMGLLSAKQGVGTVVNFTTAARYMTTLADHLLLKPATVREFLEARIFVERATVRLAAMRASQSDLDQMKAILDQQLQAFRIGDIDTFSELDAEFHMNLARASQNEVLMKFVEIIRDLLKKFIVEVSRLPEAAERAIRFHHQILDLISAGQSEKAEEMICRHLLDVVQRIEKTLKVDLDADSLFEAASCIKQ
jgi:GntR family transcriptional repressor for pyruvate dehydrogenase complex